MDIDDDMPYRGPVPLSALPADSAPVAYQEDETHYSTLVEVHQILRDAIDEINDFKVLEVMKNYPKDQATANLLRQIEVKQDVYDILLPIVEKVDSAVSSVVNKNKPQGG